MHWTCNSFELYSKRETELQCDDFDRINRVIEHFRMCSSLSAWNILGATTNDIMDHNGKSTEWQQFIIAQQLDVFISRQSSVWSVPSFFLFRFFDIHFNYWLVCVCVCVSHFDQSSSGGDQIVIIELKACNFLCIDRSIEILVFMRPLRPTGGCKLYAFVVRLHYFTFNLHRLIVRKNKLVHTCAFRLHKNHSKWNEKKKKNEFADDSRNWNALD